MKNELLSGSLLELNIQRWTNDAIAHSVRCYQWYGECCSSAADASQVCFLPNTTFTWNLPCFWYLIDNGGQASSAATAAGVDYHHSKVSCIFCLKFIGWLSYVLTMFFDVAPSTTSMWTTTPCWCPYSAIDVSDEISQLQIEQDTAAVITLKSSCSSSRCHYLYQHPLKWTCYCCYSLECLLSQQ